jgi:hypothetical protein
MAEKSYVTIPVGMERVDALPYEKNTRFLTYEEAEQYATTDPTAYSGQILMVKGDGNNWYTYQIQEDKTLVNRGLVRTKYFTPDQIQNGKLHIKMDLVPSGIISPGNVYFGIVPDGIDETGAYILDVTGFDIQGIWKVVI